MIQHMINQVKCKIKSVKRRVKEAKQLTLSYCFSDNPAVMDCRRAGMCIHIS